MEQEEQEVLHQDVQEVMEVHQYFHQLHQQVVEEQIHIQEMLMLEVQVEEEVLIQDLEELVIHHQYLLHKVIQEEIL